MAFRYYRAITINADAYISATTSNVPVLIKFNSTSHPNLFNGDDGDSIKFTSDSAGNTQLPHECVLFNTTTAIFYVKCSLSHTADTTIYVWYGDTANSGEEDKTNVWTNAVTIAHYVTDETNPTATVGTDGTKTNATHTTSGVVGGAYTTASNGYITHGTITPTSITVLFWIKKNGCSTNYTKLVGELFESETNVTGWEFDIPSAANGYVRFGRLSSTALSSRKSVTTSTSIKDNAWHLVVGTYDGTYIKLSIDGGTQGFTSAKGNIVYDYGSTLNVGRSGVNSGTNEEETFDNIWVFSDAKSFDWIKAVYNNVQNYSSFITVGDESTISTAYEESVSAGLGIAGAVSTQSDFNRSVSSGIGIAAAITHTGTFSQSIEAGIGLSASATLQGSYSKSVDAGLGIAGAISTSATFSRSVEAGLGIAGSVTSVSSSTLGSTASITATVTTVLSYHVEVSVTLMTLPNTVDTLQDIETLSLVGYLTPRITVSEVNNPLLSQIELTPLAYVGFTDSQTVTVELSAEILTESNVMFDNTLLLSNELSALATYPALLENTIELTPSVTAVATKLVEQTLTLTEELLTNVDYKTLIETSLTLAGQQLDVDSDTELLQPSLTLSPSVTTHKTEIIEQSLTLDGELTLSYASEVTGQTELSSTVTTVESVLIETGIDLSPTVNTKELLLIENTLELNADITQTHGVFINGTLELSAEKQIAWGTTIEPTLSLTLAEFVSSTFYDVEILIQELYLGVETIDIDNDQELLENTLSLTPLVEAKYIELIEAGVTLRTPSGESGALRFPITFPIEFEYAAVEGFWSSHETLEAELNLTTEYEDSVPKYLTANMDLSYGFTSNSLTLISDIFHKLGIDSEDFEQVLLETGIEVEIIRYGSHVVEETLGIFQYISFDYTFSTVEDLGPYDAVLFLQDGHELKRNDIIRYEGEYFSIIYNSIEKIGRNTLYVVYGLKRMTDYGLGINITVT